VQRSALFGTKTKRQRVGSFGTAKADMVAARQKDSALTFFGTEAKGQRVAPFVPKQISTAVEF